MHDHHDHDAPQAQAESVPVEGNARVTRTPLHPAETLGLAPETPKRVSGRAAFTLALAVLVPAAVLIWYQPAIGAILGVSVGLYLTNQYIDSAAAKWGDK